MLWYQQECINYWVVCLRISHDELLLCSSTQGYIERGLFKFTYGSKDSLVEFLHGDNFCQAHIKAAEAMEDPASPVVCCFADHALVIDSLFLGGGEGKKG